MYIQENNQENGAHVQFLANYGRVCRRFFHKILSF